MYLKRDIYSEDDGCLYDGENQKFLGEAYVLKPASALWKTPEEQEQVKIAIERKRRAIKNTKSFLEGIERIPFAEQLENYKAVYNKEIPKARPKVVRILHDSHIEAAVRKMKEMEKAKKLQDKIYAQLLADIEANEKAEN